MEKRCFLKKNTYIHIYCVSLNIFYGVCTLACQSLVIIGLGRVVVIAEGLHGCALRPPFVVRKPCSWAKIRWVTDYRQPVCQIQDPTVHSIRALPQSTCPVEQQAQECKLLRTEWHPSVKVRPMKEAAGANDLGYAGSGR